VQARIEKRDAALAPMSGGDEVCFSLPIR